MWILLINILLAQSLIVDGQNAPPEAVFEGNRELPEDTQPGTVVYSVVASDPDSDDSSLSLHLDSNTFQLWNYGNRGNITLLKSLNFEASTTAEFVLTVADGDQSATTYRKVITVTDVNDVQPKFSQLRYKTHLSEDTAVGSVVFSDIYVSDADVSNSEISVVCSYNPAFPNACQIFGLNTTASTNTYWSGYVYLRRPLDYETMQETYQLQLTAQDGNPVNDYRMTFEVVIDDVTDAPPFFTSTFDARINEDVAIGTYVLTVNAEDGDEKDQRPIRYSIIENPGDLFAIEADSGKITTTKSLTLKANVIGSQGIVTLKVTAQEVLSDGSLGNDSTTQSFSDVKITIIDVNDNPPMFTQTHYSVNMSESLENGQAIPNLTMHVSDADGADNAYFKFVFSGLREYEDIFRVSPPEAQGSTTATLVIQNSSALDYDFGLRVYTLEVIAKEVRTQSSLSSTAIVTIYLQDANDNVPEFNVGYYNIEDLSELTQPDNNGKAHETSIPLTITLLDENDNIPEFTSYIYQYRVQEGTTSLTTEYPIYATDLDSSRNGNNRIRYSLVSDRSGLFTINPLSGELSLNAPIQFKDGDANGRLRITVGAGNLLDGASQVDFTQNTTVEVIVEDVNNNAPYFLRNYSQIIPENIQPDVEIIRVEADDADFGVNAAVEYSIDSGADNTFQIDIYSGVISRIRGAVLDYTSKSKYDIVVKATDKGYPRLSGYATVTVTLLDNDNRYPVFTPLTTYTNVSEDAGIDFAVVSMQAIDRDSDADLRYSFVEPITAHDISGLPVNTEDYNYIELFRIDSETGQVFVNRRLDIHQVERIQYTVQARDISADDSEQVGTSTLVINIISANLHAPVFENVNRTYSMLEEQPVGSLVLVLVATDDDGDLVTYEILKQSTPDLLAVHPATGIVTVASRVDYEAIQTVTFTARAYDGNNYLTDQYADQQFTVNIININDNTPKFSQQFYESDISENSTDRQTVTTVSATDQDFYPYGDVRYRLPTSVTQFRVDEVSGLIYKIPGVVFDRESMDSLYIPVIAYDGPASPSRSSIVPVYVSIKNVNDNSPYFNEKDVYITVSDDTPIGSFVTRLFAFDDDSEDKISYSVGSDPSGRYAISDEGVITTRLPFTTTQDHTFNVIARDRADNSAVVHVHVTVIGNDVGPSWKFPSYDGDRIIVCESWSRGEVINEKKLISADGANKYYFLVNGEETSIFNMTFRLIPETGEIILQKNLDREETDRYLVQVLARDANGLVNQRYLVIDVCDENDNHPEFPVDNNGHVKDYHFTIYSNEVECVKDPVRNNACGQVKAQDLDLPHNGMIVYSISGGDVSHFVIDPDTGIISTVRGLDHPSQSLYIIQVTANNYRIVENQKEVIVSDSDRKTANVYIEVLPTPTTPTFIKKELNLYTSINTQIGTCLDSMKPADASFNSLSYSLVRETVFNGNIIVPKQDDRLQHSIGVTAGEICTIQLYNPKYVGYRFTIDVSYKYCYQWYYEFCEYSKVEYNRSLDQDYGYEHLVDRLGGPPHHQGGHYRYFQVNNMIVYYMIGYLLGDRPTWEAVKSDVIIYAVNQTSNYLFERKEVITYINSRIEGEYKSTALYVRILYAEDIHSTYIYLPTAAPRKVTEEEEFPIGLLVAMILLLPLLLLPFLLCCLLGCPCCGSLLGVNKRYAALAAAPAGGYSEESFIDDWYEQSKMYTNPAYNDNWDTGSAHMLVNLHGGKGNAGKHATTEEEITEETREYYRQYGNGSGGQMMNGVAALDTGDSHRQVTAGSMSLARSVKAESSVIVDGLIPASREGEGQTEVVEEQRVERRVEQENAQNHSEHLKHLDRRDVNPLVSSMDTEHQQTSQQMSSLSPGTIDMLDSASAYNAKVAATRADHYGGFSHTATVPRYHSRRHDDIRRHDDSGHHGDYFTSERYESDYYSDQRRAPSSRSHPEEESGMTIILDAEPTLEWL
ncbi:hypothetical protein EB796_000514 [Bugula neritina]|uniref:Cadherin domain-containing protein n=1 Tax=Bugula neritina TaxID=10212 RepID=A0A7J7KSK2_BUGNE|nr:hypothetical protein EB796_000514 [Bugula neritina]